MKKRQWYLIKNSRQKIKEEKMKNLVHKVMQSYPARALGRRLQEDWARDPREGHRVLMSLRVDFEPMG